MRVAALILSVAILASGLIVAWSINHASGKTVPVQIITHCRDTGGSPYGSRC